MPLPYSSIVSEIRTSSNCRTWAQPNAQSISRNDAVAQNRRRNKTAFWRIKCISASVKQGRGKLLLFSLVWHGRHYITAKWTLMQQMNTFLNRNDKHESGAQGVTENGSVMFLSRNWLSCFSPRPPANPRTHKTPLWSGWHWHQTQTETLSEGK